MQFEWDEEKAEINLKKHGVSFEEASTVFGDLLARIFDDKEHSFDEKRNGIVGHSIENRLLIVAFTERENDKSDSSVQEKQRRAKGENTTMQMNENDEIVPEYDLDFSKSKPNRFAGKYNKMQRTVVLDSDVVEDLPSSEAVNEALRFLSRITKQHKGELIQK